MAAGRHDALCALEAARQRLAFCAGEEFLEAGDVFGGFVLDVGVQVFEEAVEEGGEGGGGGGEGLQGVEVVFDLGGGC